MSHYFRQPPLRATNEVLKTITIQATNPFKEQLDQQGNLQSEKIKAQISKRRRKLYCIVHMCEH